MVDANEMRRKFHELGRRRDELLAAMQPVRDQHDALMSQAQTLSDAMRPLRDQLQELGQPIFDIDQERAMLSRALGHKTGESV